MENSVAGVIASGVVCGVLFVIVVAIICFLLYRCQRYHDDKSSQHSHLVNGNVTSEVIPTVAALVPLSSPSRQLYQFPTMPVRHMTTYRPRYIEEVKPDGQKAHTYSGEYAITSRGPVFYDVRQHGGNRANRQPFWVPRGQEEAEATMVLGEESSTSEQFILEENNNRTSVKRETSVVSNTEENAKEPEMPSFSLRTKDIRLPSPDETRRSYLFTSEPEEEVARNNPDVVDTLGRESAKYSKLKPLQEPRRQRRGEEGSVLHYPPPDYD